MNFISSYSTFIRNEISQLNLPDSPKNLYEPLDYLLSLQGKKIRPILTLLSAELFGGTMENAKHAAMAIEIFHNFTLVHDDIMDKAPLRRGKKTIHKKWNSNIAILSGDVLLVKAYEQLNLSKAELVPELLRVFNKTAIEVCEGQQMDMDFENMEHITEQEYIEMIRLKTSVLLGCALELGAIISNESEENRKKIYDFGVNIGIAFQIQDDLLDLYGDPLKVGKQTGGDIIANKNTMLSIMASNHANEKDLNELKNLKNLKNHQDKISRTQTIFNKIQVREKCTQVMQHYHTTAIHHFNSLNTSDISNDLLKLTDVLLKREF